MRQLAIVGILAACGDSPGVAVDGDGGGGGGDPDGGVPATCAAPPLFADGRTPARVLHVAAGAPAGGDGSPGAPFRSIEEAAAAATPGTAIRLGPGMHANAQYVSGLRGTAEAPIWIGGERGQPLPVISGGGEALHLTRPAYVVVHDLELTGQTANGLNVDDGGDFADQAAAHHVAITGVFVHDIGTGGNNDCIKLSGVNDVAVYGARLERCGAGGSGIDHVGCHRSVVAGSTFDGAMATAVQAKGGSTDVDVRDNRIRITGGRAINLGGSTDLTLFRPPLSATAGNAEARRVRVYNNVITGMTATATPFAFVGCVDCLAAHNLVRGQQRWHVRILQETPTQGGYTFEPARGGRVLHNSFVFDSSTLSTAVNVGAGTEPSTFAFARNLWYATDDPGRSAPMLPVTEDGGVVGQPSGYVNLPDDPRAPILSPPSTGCAEWAARPARLAEVPGTLDGRCRDSATTIGPQEAISGTL